MTDDDVEEMIPAVDEFIAAVASKNKDLVHACLYRLRNDLNALAVVTAVIAIDRASDARATEAKLRDKLAFMAATNQQQANEINRLRESVTYLRKVVDEQAARMKEKGNKLNV